ECPSCRAGETSQCTSAVHVFGILADGGYASEMVAPSSAFYSVPVGLPAVHAAALHCTFGTAYRDLVTLGRLSPGERVLITGANGGVGSAAVQVASRVGAHVVAVVRDEQHAGFVRELGADEVVVDGGGRFSDRVESLGPVDLALEAVGAPTFL